MDLPPGVLPPKLVTIPARPEPIQIDLARTALLEIDMQNSGLKEGGQFMQHGWDRARVSAHYAVVEKHQQIIPACRKAGAKIIYIKMSYNKDYSNSGGPESPNWHKELALVSMRKRPELWGKFMTEGTWDEEIIDELKPEVGDIVVRKHRYSAFIGTDLDNILKTYNIKYCMYIGLTANICVESTLRDGFFLDYWPILVADATDSNIPGHETYRATLWNVENLFGWVTTTAELVQALAGK